MTPAEAALILTQAAAFDRRTISDLDAKAWAAALQDINYHDASQAVTQHYATTTDWLMPAHIRRLVKTITAKRLEHTELTIPDADPDNPVAYAAALRAGRVREMQPGEGIGNRPLSLPPSP